MILKVTSRIARWGRLLFLPFFGCSRSHLPDRNIKNIIFLASGILFFSTSQSLQAIQLSSDVPLATAGFYQLRWTVDDQENNSFQLQESRTENFNAFKVIYQGRDLASVVSGKSNGDYFYRVAMNETANFQQSNIVKVTVAHHSLKNAILFFISGAIVFITMLVFIVKGNRDKSN